MRLRMEKNRVNSLIKQALVWQSKMKRDFTYEMEFRCVQADIHIKALKTAGVRYLNLQCRRLMQETEIGSLEEKILKTIKIDPSMVKEVSKEFENKLNNINFMLKHLCQTKKQWTEVVEKSELSVYDLDRIEELEKQKKKIERRKAQVDELIKRRIILDKINDEIGDIRLAVIQMQ